MPRRQRLNHFYTGCSFLIVAGCTSTANDSDSNSGGGVCGSDQASIEIGTGSLDYEEFSEGDPVMMVHGPQGGWHMLGAIRATNTTSIIRIAFEIRDLNSNVFISDTDYHVMLKMDEDEECTGIYPAMFGFLDVTDLVEGELDEPAELLSYSEVEMTMSIEDHSEPNPKTASASLIVTAIPDPQDVKDDAPDTGGLGDTGHSEDSGVR